MLPITDKSQWQSIAGIELESRSSNSQFRFIQIDMENCFFMRKKISIGLINYLLRWIKTVNSSPLITRECKCSLNWNSTTYKCLWWLWVNLIFSHFLSVIPYLPHQGHGGSDTVILKGQPSCQQPSVEPQMR